MDKVIQTDEEKKGINFENLFNASSKWIENFKKKHSFSRRKFHKKRRTKTKLSNIINLLRIVCKIFNNSPKNKILNVDETCWCFQESGEYTWAETGTENVSIYSNVDEKSNFTYLATINAEG